MVLLVLVLLFMSQWIFPVSAFDVRNGDNLVISSPVSDDLLISGNSVIINAPVRSVTFAGGELIVNAPIEKNLIAASGSIQVNAPVGSDLIAAGGEIDVNTNVSGKILAAGGVVNVNGSSSNAAITAGTVHLKDKNLIKGDALISSSRYQTKGKNDEISQNTAQQEERAPNIDFKSIQKIINIVLIILWIFFGIGMLILGLILIKLLPAPFQEVAVSLRDKPMLSLIWGFFGCIIGILAIVLLVFSVVGIPIAIFMGSLLLAGLLISPLITGAALGLILSGAMKKDLRLTWAFILGYICLEILFLIPVIGFIVKVFTLFSGLGSLLLVFHEKLRTTN